MNRLSNPDQSGARGLSRQRSRDILEWTLRPWWRAAIFLIVIISGAAFLSVKAIRAAESAYWADSDSIDDIKQTLKHDPTNADLIHRLGLDYTFNPTEINTPEAVKYLRQAVSLNPRRWDFYSDLGTACDFAGDIKCSDEAFDHARALNPMNPALEWALGNHYLLTNRPDQAFPFFRKLIDINSDYLGPTFRLCMRATRDPEQIYSAVIPHGKDLKDSSQRFAFLNFLASTGDYDGAMKIWGQMIGSQDKSPGIFSVKPFMDNLIDHDRLQDASVVWGDLEHAGVVPPPSAPGSANLLYNPGFESTPLDTGFDWRLSDSSDLVFEFTDESPHQRRKSLRIDFSVGRNADYDLVSQIVQVQPNTSYDLTAYVRSESLTSDSGPRLRVVELDCGSCNPATSDQTQGTTQWHQVDAPFLTHPQTQLVRVSFWRPQAPTALGDITGTVWLDDLTLRATGPSAPMGKLARTP